MSQNPYIQLLFGRSCRKALVALVCLLLGYSGVYGQDKKVPDWLQQARDSVQANPKLCQALLNDHASDTSELSQHAMQLYLFMYGASYVWLEQREVALPYFYRSLDMCVALRDTQQIIVRRRSIAASAFYLGDYASTLEQRLAILDLVQQDSVKLRRGYLEVGASHYYLLNKPEALKYMQLAYEVAVGLRDTSSLGTLCSNIGAIHRELGHLDTARVYLEQSVQWLELADNKIAWTRASAILGEMLHLELEDREGGWKYLNQALEYSRTMADSSMHAFVKVRVGKCMLAENRVQSAIPLFKHALKIYESLALKDGMMMASDRLAEAYYQAGQYAAYKDLNTWRDELRDSIFQEKTAAQVGKLEALYETERQARMNLELQQENETKTQEVLREQRLRRNLLIGFVALVVVGLLVGWLLLDRSRQRQRNRLQQAVIQEKEKGLDAVFTATEEERKRIAKDLHDGIGQQLTALHLGIQRLNKDLEGEEATEAKRLLDLIQETAKDTREISHQMMPNNLLRLGLVPVIEETLEKTLGQAGIKYQFEHFNLQDRYPEEKEVAIYRVFQELINNVIKHARAQLVDVQLYQAQGELILLVEDDGRGLDKKAGDGHGLLNILHRITSFNGRFNLEPSMESGTTATVTIPV